MIRIDIHTMASSTRPLVVLALLVTLIPVRPVAADVANEQMTEQLLTCEEIAAPTERLRCLDAVLESLKSGASQPTLPGAVDAADVASAEATPPVVAAPPVSTQQVEAPPVAEEDRGLIETVEAPSVSSSEDRYRRDEKTNIYEHAPIPFHATIVSVKTHHDGRFSVQLDNGETWRETQGTRVRTPRRGRSVEVYEGTLGGLRMRIDGVPQSAWVRRID